MDRQIHKKTDESGFPVKGANNRERELSQMAPEPSSTNSLHRVRSNVSRPSDILKLQQTVGNRAVTGLIQRNKVINDNLDVRGFMSVSGGIISQDYVKSGTEMYVGSSHDQPIHAGRLVTPGAEEEAGGG